MSRNGSGTYTLPAGNPVVTGTTITSSWANTTMQNIADGLTQSVASDGQTPMSGSLNMANNKIISVTDPTSAQDAATKAYADALIAGTVAGSFTSVTDSGLTSGRVTYATTGGLLTDDADLTFDGTTLTAAKGANFCTTSGNVGIGTASPAAILSANVNGTGSVAALNLTNSDSSFAAGTGTSINFGLVNTNLGAMGKIAVLNESATIGSNSYMAFSTRFSDTLSEKIRIDSAGNLLVGTTVAAPTSGIYLAAPSSSQIQIGHPNGTGTGIAYEVYYYNGSVIGSINQNGTTSVTYNTSSDYRLKEDIAPMTGALDKVSSLKPVTYKWKSDGSNGQGFIAHELQAVVPDCVTGEKDAVDADGKPIYQGIDTSFLVATLTAAIQELKAEFDTYKASHP